MHLNNPYPLLYGTGNDLICEPGHIQPSGLSLWPKFPSPRVEEWFFGLTFRKAQVTWLGVALHFGMIPRPHSANMAIE